ncbi:HNH endonuclease [Pedobacter sp.]|uniref:HNH endonuclease n=1 Tax=Pedobacter sp. TaxID=1411316 RepID=UPI00396CD497
MKDTILSDIYKVMQHEAAPLNANEIQKKLTSIGRTKKNTKEIGADQIRKRIRENPSLFGIIKEAKPNTYILKHQNFNLWVLKTVHEDDKASQTIDSYEDSLSEHYNYDNFVANSKQVAKNDLAILIDKEKILGFAKIDHIQSTKGTKVIRRCPECPSTTIDKRKTKTPVYRCNKGHEFEIPLEEPKAVTKYSAVFNVFISVDNLNSNLNQLRPYYSNGYNQNMSIQLLSVDVLFQFEGVYEQLLTSSNSSIKLEGNEGYEEGDQYISNDLDEREKIIRSIKLRRGQQEFRRKLLKRYNNTCVITGCKIVDILEAAHIKPYRGANDNHLSNGILLRADIHTLFDLNLVAIEPKTLKVHFNRRVAQEYTAYHLKKLDEFSDLIDERSLADRWSNFIAT